MVVRAPLTSSRSPVRAPMGGEIDRVEAHDPAIGVARVGLGGAQALLGAGGGRGDGQGWCGHCSSCG
jgi:hypothetical protein